MLLGDPQQLNQPMQGSHPDGTARCPRHRRAGGGSGLHGECQVHTAAGKRAALALSDLISRQTVFCQQRGTDRYGRAVAVCSVGGQDLGAWMVLRGHALAYRKYSHDYVAAAAAHEGIWAGEFQAPWEWRRR